MDWSGEGGSLASFSLTSILSPPSLCFCVSVSLQTPTPTTLFLFASVVLVVTHIASDRGQTLCPVVLKGKTLHCPPAAASGCEAWPNQTFPFQGFCCVLHVPESWPLKRPCLQRSSGTLQWSFRDQMRCKSIKSQFVCRFQPHWGSFPCHSGAVNFLLINTQTLEPAGKVGS